MFSRQGVRQLLLALALAALGYAAWSIVGPGFTRAFQGLAEVTLGEHEFGHGGHATFGREAAATPHAGLGGATHDDQSWDAPVTLHIDGVTRQHVVRINPRRLAYLPWILLLAVSLSAPLRASRRLLVVALGSAGVLAMALGSVWITLAWIFGQVPGLVYDASPTRASLLQLAYEGLVTPIGNKFALPLLLALALVAWQRRAHAIECAAR